MKKLFKYFIDRPLLVNLLAVLIILLGLVSSARMNREGLPKVDMRRIEINTVYPGASPEDVELNVTVPLEEALKGVAGIEKFTSKSMENISRIMIILEDDLPDKKEVKRNIRRAVDSVNDLPKEVKERPEIFEWKIQNFAVLEVALMSDTLSDRVLIQRAKRLKKKLQDLSKVNKVEEGGLRDREIHIKVDLNRMKRNHLSFDDIIHAIQSRNINLAGGNLESYLSEKGIITVARFENSSEIKDVILRSNFEGRQIKLGQIAVVSNTLERRDRILRYNGRRGVSLLVVKKETADIIRTIEQVKSAVAQFKKTPDATGINFAFLNDMSEETSNKLQIVFSNAVIGLLLVVMVLLFFLNLRIALWTAVGLPVSIFLAIILMSVSGVTINTISLSGIIVVLGMLVDDAIIIAENCYRHRLAGRSWKEAALLGVSEVASPVMATITTTIIAFLPILFMEGMEGDFAFEIPLVIAFMLLASLFEAFFILPQHLSHGNDSKHIRKKPHDNRIFQFIERKYRPLLQYALRRRYRLIALFFFLLVLAGWHATNMKFVMFDSEQAYIFYLNGETTSGNSLEKTSDEVRRLEQFLKNYQPGVIRSFKTQVGVTAFGNSADNNFFSMVVYLTPANTREIMIHRVIKEMKQVIATNKTFEKVQFEIDSGPPVGKPLELLLIGNDDRQRLAAQKAVYKLFRTKPFYTNALYELNDDYKPGKEELRIKLRYSRIARYGIAAHRVARTIRTAFNGTVVTHLQTKSERIPLRVLLNDSYRRTAATLKQLTVPNQRGRLVPVRELLDIRQSRSAKRINHFNGERSIRISANIDNSKATPVQIYSRLKKDLHKLQQRFPGLTFKIEGEAYQSRKTMESFFTAFIIALVGIYFLLVLLFNSFSQPVLVITAIPFGLIGVVLAFSLHGTSFSLMALIGIVGLTGVVVNDSLVLIGFINGGVRRQTERPDKEQLFNLIVEGTVTRLRPILLTTITTAAGLLPTAYGIGGYDYTISPMVLAISWGLVFATTLTLLLIPALYLVNEDLKRFFKRLFKRE